MEDRVTLVRAFKIRNIAKSRLQDISNSFSYVEKRWDETKTPEFKNTGGWTPECIITDWCHVNSTIAKLNLLINEANKEKAQDVILKINERKAVNRFLYNVITEAKSSQPDKKEINPVTGVETITKYKTFGDLKEYMDWQKKSNRELLALEDELAQINATTYVNVSSIKGELEDIVNEW